MACAAGRGRSYPDPLPGYRRQGITVSRTAVVNRQPRALTEALAAIDHSIGSRGATRYGIFSQDRGMKSGAAVNMAVRLT